MAFNNTKVFYEQGGEELGVASGGKIHLQAGAQLIQNASVTNIVTAGAETYTAAQIATGIITRDPTGASRTDTTDTAVALIAALGMTEDGAMFDMTLVNTADAAEVITLAGGVGVTIANVGQTLAQNEAATLRFRRASSTTVSLYIVGA